MIEAYVDGSFVEKNGKQIAGWAFVVIENDEIQYEENGADVPETYYEHRNIAGEIYGVLKLLEFCIENDVPEIAIYYDYEGLEKWATYSWKANKEITKQYQKFVNSCGVKITWNKVVGHSGNKWNNYADLLAKEAVEMSQETTEIYKPITIENDSNQPETLPKEENIVIDEYGMEVPVETMEPPTEISYNTNPALGETIRQEFHVKPQPFPQVDYIKDEPNIVQGEIETAAPTEAPKATEDLGPNKDKILEARELCKKSKFMEAASLLRPLINRDSDEKTFKEYIDIIVNLGDFYAQKAVIFCEAYLPNHPKSKVLKSYCYALYFGFVRPVIASPIFDGNKYNQAKIALRKILSISKNSKIIIEFVYPLMEYSFRIGDKKFVRDTLKQFDINLFSKEKVRLSTKIFPSQYDRANYMLHNLNN